MLLKVASPPLLDLSASGGSPDQKQVRRLTGIRVAREILSAILPLLVA